MIDDVFLPMEGQSAAPRQPAGPGGPPEPSEAFPDLASAAGVSGSDQEAPTQQRNRRYDADHHGSFQPSNSNGFVSRLFTNLLPVHCCVQESGTLGTHYLLPRDVSA